MMRSGLLAVCLAAGLVLPGLASAQAPAAPDWLAGDVDVAFASLSHATVSGGFAVHQFTMSGRTMTAQDLRASYQQALAYGQGTVFLAMLQDSLGSALEDKLAALFPGANVTVTDSTIDPASLQPQAGPDPWHPPVRVRFAATVAFDLAQLFPGAALPVTEKSLSDALDIGATAQVPYDLLAPPGYNITFTFTLPPGIRATDAPGAQMGGDGTKLTWSLVNWRGSTVQAQSARITLASLHAPTQWATDARAELSVDMHDVEGLTLPGLLSGDYGALAVHVDARIIARSLNLSDLPRLAAQVRARLPAGVELQGMDADGLRVAVRDGLVTPGMLDEVERTFRDLAAERLQGLSPQQLDLHGGFAAGTLDASHVSDPLDGDPPLTYLVQGDVRIPLSPQAQPLAAATVGGPVLLQRTLTFQVPRVEGMDTTYRISLPVGISLADLQLTHATATESLEGGRYVVVVTPTADDAEGTFTVAVTGAFVLAQFWYVLAALVLLVIVAVVAVVMLRRRKRGRAQSALAEPPAPAQP